MFSDFKIHKDRSVFYDELLDWLKIICATFVVMLLIFTYVARTAVVKGQSMEPTLKDGDMLLMWSLGYEPEQGDIVACNCYGLERVIVKRIAAKGGQSVYIDFDKGKVFVDGEEFIIDGIENLTIDSESGYDYPLRVPPDCYFVLGDNRSHSTDSRSAVVGFISREEIIGRAVIRILPLARAGKISS